MRNKETPVMANMPIVVLAFIFTSLACMSGRHDNPEINEKWFRGNTHTHARFSDENDSNDVPVIANWYREAGYDFLVLSEHNDHVAEKKIFCHDEASALPDFLMICGLELSNSRHHTAFGINSYIGDETSLEDGVEKIIAAGGIPILNHPRDPVITVEEFLAIKGLNHLEIVNGGRREDTPATEILWDSILSAPDGRIVYAVGADDNHYKHENVARGWIMVRSPALTRNDIIGNIKDGNFYASSGIVIDDYKVNNRNIFVSSQNGDSILFIGKNGNVMKRYGGTKAKYKIKGDEKYVRVKVFSNDGKSAWTQPVVVP